jgi:hypothetical protein
MANQYEDDDFDEIEDTQEQNVPANLRKALKRAEKEKKDLAEQLAAIQSDLRSRSVKDVLASKGVPDKVAKFIPSDVSTPEQVDAWLTENADVFGFSKQVEPDEASDETKANVASYQRINASTQNASAPSRDADMASKLNSNALTKADLDALTGNVSGRFRGQN